MSVGGRVADEVAKIRSRIRERRLEAVADGRMEGGGSGVSGIGDVPGLTGALAGKSDVGHGHVSSALSDSTVAGRAVLTAADASAQRSMLGLGSSAVTASTAYATAAQGGLAGSALQPGALIPWTDVSGKPSTFAPDLTAHLGAADPHPQYLTPAEGDAAYATVGHVHGAATGSVAGFMAAADKTKLDGIAAGATVNAADADLRDRATHTGTQAASTISDFNASARGQVEGAIIAGANVTVTPAGSGATRTLTIAATGGGGGSPGGVSGEVQYNNAGAFAGAADVEIEGGQLRLPAIAVPAAPAAGGVKLFGVTNAGKSLPAFVAPVGTMACIQPALHCKSVFAVGPSNGTTAPSVLAGNLTTAATISHQQTIASANPWLATRRTRFQTSTTAGNASGMRTPYGQWFRGNAAGYGGFFFRCKLGHNINLNGGQVFVGLAASTGALAGEPSALVNMIGMGYDAADANTGAWQLMRNDGAGVATKVALGASMARSNTTHGYDLVMFLAPGASEIFVKIANLHTGVVELDTSYTTDIPAANVGLAFHAQVRNGAVAAAANVEVANVYIESDF